MVVNFFFPSRVERLEHPTLEVSSYFVRVLNVLIFSLHAQIQKTTTSGGFTICRMKSILQDIYLFKLSLTSRSDEEAFCISAKIST